MGLKYARHFWNTIRRKHSGWLLVDFCLAPSFVRGSPKKHLLQTQKSKSYADFLFIFAFFPWPINAHAKNVRSIVRLSPRIDQRFREHDCASLLTPLCHISIQPTPRSGKKNVIGLHYSLLDQIRLNRFCHSLWRRRASSDPQLQIRRFFSPLPFQFSAPSYLRTIIF